MNEVVPAQIVSESGSATGSEKDKKSLECNDHKNREKCFDCYKRENSCWNHIGVF